MGRLRTFGARPQGKLLAAWPARRHRRRGDLRGGGGGKSSTGTGPHQSIVIHHATATTATSPAKIGAGSRVDAVANVLDVDVKIGEYHSDYMTYARISADALAQYSAAFDPSQYTVVPTQAGRLLRLRAERQVVRGAGGVRTAAEGDVDAEPALQAVTGCNLRDL